MGGADVVKPASEGEGQNTLLATGLATPACEGKKQDKVEEPHTVVEKIVEVAEEVKEKVEEIAEKVKDAVIGSEEPSKTVEEDKPKEAESTVAKPIDIIVEKASAPMAANCCWTPFA